MPTELLHILPFAVIEPWDKLGHLLWFSALTALLWSMVRAPFAVIAAVTAFGALDEVCQSFDPARSADLSDFAVNTCAALLTVLLLRKYTCVESSAP